MPLRLLLVALATSAAVHVFTPAFVGRLTLYDDNRLVRVAFAYPASVAISMVVTLSALGIPRDVLDVGSFFSADLILMTWFAARSSLIDSGAAHE